MPTDSGQVATVRSLRKSYPGGVVALDGVDLDLDSNSVTALTGPNGSGKTTLLRILAGRLAPTSGTAIVLGVDPAASSSLLRRRLSFVSQELALDPEMTGAQTLRLFAVLYGLPRGSIGARVDELARSLELMGHLAMPVHAYSGGLRRRLHLALGLLQEPELLLLDEPTAGLDPAGRAFLWGLLKRLAERSRSVVVITHDLGEVERHCDRVAVMLGGKILAFSSPQVVVRQHARRMLQIELAEDVAATDTRLANLRQILGAKFLAVQRTKLSVQLDDPHSELDRILAMLAAQHLEARAFQVHEPDLATAYFGLTGVSAEEPPTRRGEPGAGRRRGENGEPG